MNDLLNWLAVTQAEGFSNTILVIWFFLAGQTLTSRKIGKNLMAVRAVAVAAIFIGTRVVLANVLITFPDPTGPRFAAILTGDFVKILWNGAALLFTCFFWVLAQYHRTIVLTRKRLIVEGRLPMTPGQEN